MNENDRTILEQAIYEEMELTPEMIRSIRTLCGVCLCSFVESKAFKIAIVPSADLIIFSSYSLVPRPIFSA